MKITRSMFENVEYDEPPRSAKDANSSGVRANEVPDPTVMLVFSESDLNSAAYRLVQSMQNPLAVGAVVTVLVQESVSSYFTAKVKEQIIHYLVPEDLVEIYKEAEERLSHFNANVIRPTNDLETSSPVAGPSIVCDFTHEQLGLQTGSVVTLQTFRTTKEAIALARKQGTDYRNASIWTENHARAYEVAVALRCSHNFINCQYSITEEFCADTKDMKSFAVMDKGYHVEKVVTTEGMQTIIMFPYGTIFAN